MAEAADTNRTDTGAAVPFTRPFVHSPGFRDLFREGMDLVEEAAAYLDGEGRDHARFLPRDVALAYSTESMRLTTRLMQLASWLLVHRALSTGEMTTDEAEQQRSRIRFSRQNGSTAEDIFERLPERLRTLVARSLRLQDRVRRLDAAAEPDPAPAAPVRNPVAVQQLLLRAVFETDPR